MSFSFTEHFTVEFPEIKKEDFNFSESFDNGQGLIIEVAAIHERNDCELQ
jgi:hypothetical protein